MNTGITSMPSWIYDLVEERNAQFFSLKKMETNHTSLIEKLIKIQGKCMPKAHGLAPGTGGAFGAMAE